MAGLCHGQGGKLLGEHIPALLGIDGQAGVDAHCKVAGAAQLLPQFGRNEETALGIDAVFIGTCHAAQAVHFLHFDVFLTFWLPFTPPTLLV
ncbi:hypothetical protein SDC9_112631 [bioreactor metagenome]|uniref:Uncharacterized protein n=1 Tax=bioreactor metagenome TaxID=1076179 RepID=A0A645BMH3_9ZZZZ